MNWKPGAAKIRDTLWEPQCQSAPSGSFAAISLALPLCLGPAHVSFSPSPTPSPPSPPVLSVAERYLHLPQNAGAYRLGSRSHLFSSDTLSFWECVWVCVCVGALSLASLTGLCSPDIWTALCLFVLMGMIKCKVAACWQGKKNEHIQLAKLQVVWEEFASRGGKKNNKTTSWSEPQTPPCHQPRSQEPLHQPSVGGAKCCCYLTKPNRSSVSLNTIERRFSSIFDQKLRAEKHLQFPGTKTRNNLLKEQFQLVWALEDQNRDFEAPKRSGSLKDTENTWQTKAIQTVFTDRVLTLLVFACWIKQF